MVIEIDQREKDIQALCNAVLNVSPLSTGDYKSGSMCPFCYNDLHWNASDLSAKQNKGYEHSLNCVYLIAKDLSTGHNTNQKQS